MHVFRINRLSRKFAGDYEYVSLKFHKLTCSEIFGFSNVLHIWSVHAIPTYRVYQLYDTEHCMPFSHYQSGEVHVGMTHILDTGATNERNNNYL